ncbi:MAG TPA: beta galactosidase jelly roll domain-containing protein [Lentisphaeria bacterium]|nr:hypothetical protein [Lentisphaerota bacterium]OQC16740.1 MAG: Glycosyl hydrolases family 2, sugar binding domain [Lentisphaerae bacterium ADurb.Bin082]HQC51847.1 beta galactosidase jelly roll domain-containing protein [Lentisphaeria bacterium]HQL85990.1 beta galactosidase jelly roll domain-containing protein [Lentisphaeria bacterium]
MTMKRFADLFAGTICLTIILATGCASPRQADNAKARRQLALDLAEHDTAKAVPALTILLQDDNVLVRRAAVHSLAVHGQTGRDALHQALCENSDEQTRRMALQLLCQNRRPDDCLDFLETALSDQSLPVRVYAATFLASEQPATGRRQQLLQKASHDEEQAVRLLVMRAIWPFHCDAVLLRDRQDWDHDVVVKERHPLPETGWKIAIDNDVQGHIRNWFKSDFDDSAWTDIEIAKYWEPQGINHDGFAWYRGTFKAPAKPARFNAAELLFGGVDECAWVWLNGVYIGDHDLGPMGWNLPFSLDVTKVLKWGEDNQLTVRVHDSNLGGGIWKPITLEILE